MTTTETATTTGTMTLTTIRTADPSSAPPQYDRSPPQRGTGGSVVNQK
jgi:hypothetical protein